MRRVDTDAVVCLDIRAVRTFDRLTTAHAARIREQCKQRDGTTTRVESLEGSLCDNFARLLYENSRVAQRDTKHSAQGTEVISAHTTHDGQSYDSCGFIKYVPPTCCCVLLPTNVCDHTAASATLNISCWHSWCAHVLASDPVRTSQTQAHHTHNI